MSNPERKTVTVTSISIALNGEQIQVPSGKNVLGLLEHLEIPPDRVAVELDRQIVPKRDWETTAILDGAQIEIVHFVGGG